MSFLEDVRTRAAAKRRRVVFPESTDDRVVEAVVEITKLKLADAVLVIDPQRRETEAAARAAGVETLDPSTHSLAAVAAERLFAARKHKGMTEETAMALGRTPLYFADALVATGQADACVAGAVHTTADVLRAALVLVGPAAGVKTVSSAFYMVTPPFRGGDSAEVLTFTDCAVVPYPTVEELADIALAAAADRHRIVGDTPIVALLSFSTHGSAGGRSVERVREAVKLIRSRAPQLAVDGELQGDAALVAAVASRKTPGSAVAGRANVLVFPTLDAGNIGYKLVQRLAGAIAVGPIIQGLRRPCSDLSRGAAVDDIINVAAITALQAEPG
jgi:phosphate acetyltransferase